MVWHFHDNDAQATSTAAGLSGGRNLSGTAVVNAQDRHSLDSGARSIKVWSSEVQFAATGRGASLF